MDVQRYIRYVGLTISMMAMYVSVAKTNPVGLVVSVFTTALFLYKILFAPLPKDDNEGD